MINPGELRIGNWLLYEGRPVQVEAIDPEREVQELGLKCSITIKEYFVGDSGPYTTNGRWLKRFEPILLNPEWMKRLGFKWQDRDINARILRRFYISEMFGEHREYWLEMNMPDENWKMDTWFWWLNWDIGGGRQHIHLPRGGDIKHVHQVQNLYRELDGSDLQIKSPQ